MALLRRIVRHFDLSAVAHRPGAGPTPLARDPEAGSPSVTGLDRPVSRERMGLPGNGAPASGGDPGPACRSPFVFTILHYVALVLGVASKYFIESTDTGGRMDWVTLVSSAILAAVAFPFVYKKVCSPGQTDPVQFFVSFQHGFFIQTILEEVQKTLV